MRLFTKYLVCFLVFGLFLSFSYAQKPSDKDETPIGIDKAKESTVRLVGARLNEPIAYFSGGTGFFVTPDKIATNFHVAAGPTTGPIFAKLGHRETIWRIEGVWAYDAKSDIAILKVEGEGKPLALVDVDTLKIGETVYLAGFPYSREYKVVDGILEDIRSSDKWLKTTVAAYPGNSGSPMINSKGEVIGIHAGHSYDSRPSNAIKALLESSTSAEPLSEWRKRGVVRAYVYHSRGMQKFYEQEYAEAIKHFNKAIETNPDDAENYIQRAHSKSRLRDHEGAIQDFNQAIVLNPIDAETYKIRGDAKGRLGDKSGKIKDYMQALKIEPNANTYSILGHIKQSDGDLEGAIEYFTEVIKLKPNEPYGYNIRARAKKRMGDYAGAIEDFTQAIKSNPDAAWWPYYDRAKVKHKTKDYAGAIDDCNLAIELEPDVSYAYSLRGKIKVDLEDYAGAIEDYTQAIKVSLGDRPGIYAAYINRGNVKRKSNDYDGAFEDYNMAIKLIPENAYGYIDRGLAKADLKDYSGAITDYDKAIELNNEYAEGYHYRGLAKEALGQHDAAKIDFDKAKEIDPEVGE